MKRVRKSVVESVVARHPFIEKSGLFALKRFFVSNQIAIEYSGKIGLIDGIHFFMNRRSGAGRLSIFNSRAVAF
ncbi:hypothetical protein [Paraburkholderia antibiotica]|uniref:Uncharacterized protein n=1 Tax=Paraburkholderia antibiotica TaxID=2728839 RepID=A0A7Y0A0H6_9BURK|nr:hypothetical protein [Paraburkholderia antibiotica]NML34225.1 hypothetical protein [Paraburkholderia antibiotica]